VGRTCLHLEAKAVGEGPAPGFGCLEQDGFARVAAVRVLDGRINFIEERKLIEIPLRIEERALAERVAGCIVMARATVAGRV